MALTARKLQELFENIPDDLSIDYIYDDPPNTPLEMEVDMFIEAKAECDVRRRRSRLYGKKSDTLLYLED